MCSRMEVGADMKIKTLLVDSNHSLRDQLKVLLQIFRVFQLEAELDRTEDALEYGVNPKFCVNSI